MKESQFYIQFVKRHLLFLILPILLCLVISIYLYAGVPTQVKISQTFKLNYNLENINTMLALTDQAVAELRAQRFSDIFAGSSVLIYKSAPLNISIESITQQRETSYNLLLKESEYLRQHFEVEELTSPEITLIEPNLFKYLISGLIIGGLIGLIISLTREYLKNY
jgi:hypothetical protein